MKREDRERERQEKVWIRGGLEDGTPSLGWEVRENEVEKSKGLKEGAGSEEGSGENG